MAYRNQSLAPASQVPQARRGATGGRFCHGCGNIYSRYASRHIGKPVYGKDHVSTPCSHEGEPFQAGAGWWEAAVEVRPESVDDSTAEESG